jgi:hypothetical protein
MVADASTVSHAIGSQINAASTIMHAPSTHSTSRKIGYAGATSKL